MWCNSPSFNIPYNSFHCCWCEKVSSTFLKDYLFERERERERQHTSTLPEGAAGEGDGAPSTLLTEWGAWHWVLSHDPEITSLSSRPEPKVRVGCSTNCTTQTPWKC